MSELVIRMIRSEGHAVAVKVEVDGRVIERISQLQLNIDTLNPAPQLDIEFLRGFVLLDDLPPKTRDALDEDIQALKPHHAHVRAPE